MKISIAWLKEFVSIDGDAKRLRSDLTMIGLNTEAIAQVGDDHVLDVEVTTNRPDCLNHYGVARELATLYRLPLKKVEVTVTEAGGRTRDAASVEIADPDLCARYCARVIQNVKAGPSPAWLAKRLEAVGQRPINNIADVTNYVLMELGHPLHAFDFSRLQQQRIIVRRARPGEHLRTLDGVDRTLARDNLVIADGVRPVALAGVMGGEESEISASTRAVLLESAWFDPVSIRRTSKSQGMHTEASHRFERGADIEMAPLALDRAAALIREVAGGEILAGMIDAYPRPIERPQLTLAPSEIPRILGSDVPAEEIERILRGLGFSMAREDARSWRVSVPSFRVDVSRAVDLVEEVARHVGYDRLPARVRPAPPRIERDTNRDKVIAATSLLAALGFHEMISTSMVDPEETQRFSADRPVVLANPLSQEASAMRTSAVPSMLGALRWNLDRDSNDVRLFELGKTYRLGADGVPQERRVLTLGVTGHRRPASVHDSAAPFDFFDLKGDLETLFEAFALPGLTFAACRRSYLQTARSGCFHSQDLELAVFGMIAPELAHEYKLRQDVWVAEMDFERLLEYPLRAHKFQPISKFPAVERDFSLVAPDELPYARLASAINGLGLEEIRGFQAADRADRSKVPSLPAGHYTLLLRVTFQSPSRTLNSEEIGELSQRLLASLEKLGARLRS